MFLLCPSRNQSLSPDRFSTTTTTFRLFSFFNQLLHTLTWKFLLKHYQSDSIKTKIWNQKITLEIQRSTQERSTTLPLSHTVYDTTTVGSRTSVILWFLTWVHSPRKFWIEKRIPCSVFSEKKISEADLLVLVCPKKPRSQYCKKVYVRSLSAVTCQDHL
jgi:hypothetical protein